MNLLAALILTVTWALIALVLADHLVQNHHRRRHEERRRARGVVERINRAAAA